MLSDFIQGSWWIKWQWSRFSWNFLCFTILIILLPMPQNNTPLTSQVCGSQHIIISLVVLSWGLHLWPSTSQVTLRKLVYSNVKSLQESEWPNDRITIYSILKSNPRPNLICTSFCQFLKWKKKLVRSCNPQLLQKSRSGWQLHGKPSWRALLSDLSRSVA